MEITQKWCYHFMHRNYLNFRRSIHISQKHPENYLNRMQEFLYYHIKFKTEYDFELNAIANMDDTYCI